MSSQLPFGNNTLVIPFTMVLTRPGRRGGGGMSRMRDPATLYRYGVAPQMISNTGERSYAPVPRQAPPAAPLAKALPLPTRVQPASPASAASASGSPAAPVATSTPDQAAEPEHDRVWWWLHDHGLAQTRHEKAELLRRAMGPAGGVLYYRDDTPIDLARMSDDELLALDRNLRESNGIYPPLVPAPTKPPVTQWGHPNQAPWNAAKKELQQPGTHVTVNGRVPTLEEAVRLIEEGGGRVEGIELEHPPPSRSTHREPHINYYTRDGEKATVIVQPWQ